jgi:hypothetical protein
MNSALLNGSTSVSVAPGAVITVIATSTLGASDNWRQTGWEINQSANQGSSFDNCFNTTDQTTAGTVARSFTITAPSTAGTYNVHIAVSGSTSNCDNTNSGATLTLTGAITVVQPDLIVTKTKVGDAYIGGTFKWKLHVENIGNALATFSKGKEILKDDMPSATVGTYGVATVENKTGITGSGTIICTQTNNAKDNLVCKVSNNTNDAVVIAAGGFFDVFIDVYPTATGTLINPTNNGKCYVDKGYSNNSSNEVNESDETNNTCSNTVTVVPAPVLGCMDESATNYNSEATQDDDSCTFDTDTDGVLDGVDNCENVANADQDDSDQDEIGDACDDTPFSPATLTVHVAGAAGVIAESHGAISCGNGATNCDETYTNHETVTLTATPDTGNNFVEWSGACSGSGSCEVTMDADRDVTATFARPEEDIDVCDNLSGLQASVPDGYEQDGLSCVGPHPEENGTLIIKKEAIGGDDTFSFTVNGDEFSTTTHITTEEGSGTAEAIALTPDTDYTVDEPTVPEGWEFTSVSCEYDGESVGTTGATPTSHVVSVEAGDTVTCIYTNTKIVVDEGPACQIEGYKYDAENHPVAGLVIGAMTKPFIIDVEGQQFVEGQGKIVVTKTDEAGHYCINGFRAESARVFEWSANGTEIDHMTDGEEPIQPRINSFFDVFTEVRISMGGHQPAQMDSFFDVFIDIDGVVSLEPVSFFDIFTELNIAPAQQPVDSFFDVFTEVSLDGGRTVNFFNRPIPVAPTPPTGGGGGSSSFDYYGCTNPAATNFNSLANKDDGSCQLPGGNGEGNNPPPPPPAPAPSPAPQGEVLGAATTTPELPLPPECAANPYLRDYLKMGKKNDPEQVKLLQTLLNEQMDAHLPVTGFFGSLTKKWVKAFQKKHHAEIIKPWIDAGYKGNIGDGTGYVYKTTKRAINMIKCVGVVEPLPDLTPDI